MAINEVKQEQSEMIKKIIELRYLKNFTPSEIITLSKLKKQKYFKTLTKTQQNVLINAKKYIYKNSKSLLMHLLMKILCLGI